MKYSKDKTVFIYVAREELQIIDFCTELLLIIYVTSIRGDYSCVLGAVIDHGLLE